MVDGVIDLGEVKTGGEMINEPSLTCVQSEIMNTERNR